MIMNIIVLIKKLKQYIDLKKISKNVDIAKSAIYDYNFKISLYHPLKNRVYVHVGEQAIIYARLVFETSGGRVTVGDRTYIGGGSLLISRDSIKIGDDVTIAWGCTIYDHDSHSIYWNKNGEGRFNDIVQVYKDLTEHGDAIRNKNWGAVKSLPIIIEDKAWLGFGVTVLKGVRIGEGAVVGAKSVVTHDVEPYTVVAGNPARLVRKIV